MSDPLPSQSDDPKLGDVWRYAARPHLATARARVELPDLRHLIQLFFATVFAVMAMSVLIGPIVLSGMGGELPEHQGERLYEMNPGRLVLLAIIIGPLWEELVFRSWLGLRRVVLIGLPVLASVQAVWVASTVGASGALILPIAAGLGFLVFALWRRISGLSQFEQEHARTTLFPWIFWGATLLFTLLHGMNWEGGLSSPWLVLTLLPIALVAVVLGYVRMRYGLAPAIFFHGSYNALFVTLNLLADVQADTVPVEAFVLLQASLAPLF